MPHAATTMPTLAVTIVALAMSIFVSFPASTVLSVQAQTLTWADQAACHNAGGSCVNTVYAASCRQGAILMDASICGTKSTCCRGRTCQEAALCDPPANACQSEGSPSNAHPYWQQCICIYKEIC